MHPCLRYDERASNLHMHSIAGDETELNELVPDDVLVFSHRPDRAKTCNIWPFFDFLGYFCKNLDPEKPIIRYQMYRYCSNNFFMTGLQWNPSTTKSWVPGVTGTGIKKNVDANERDLILFVKPPFFFVVTIRHVRKKIIKKFVFSAIFLRP